jgi:thiol:disulfide interchange protein DsbC
MRKLIPFLVLLLSGTGSLHAVNSERWFSEEQVRRGSDLFLKNCAACHGQNAEATSNWKQTDANGNYPPPPLNGSAHAWHHPIKLLRRTIEEGGAKIGGTMPAFKGKLSDADIDAVIAYFQSFWPDTIYQNWADRNKASDLPTIANIEETLTTAGSSSKGKMTELLRMRIGNGKVTEPVATPVEGVFEVQYGANFGYLSADGRYLFTGNLIDLKQGQNLTEFSTRKIVVAELDRVAVEDKIVFAAIGEEKAVLNVFTDTSCPYCQKLHAEVAELQAAGISVHYLPFPRGGMQGPGYQTLKQVWCAEDGEKAMTIAKGLDTGDLPAGDCARGAFVDTGFALGKKVGVKGTPALYKSNGEAIQGYVPYRELIPRVLNN